MTASVLDRHQPQPHSANNSAGTPPQSGARRGPRKDLLVAGLFVAAIAVTASGWLLHRTGSIGASWGYLTGKPIYVRSAQTIFPGAAPGLSQTITVTNLSDNSVRILGYRAGCSCLQISGLPVALGPRQKIGLPISAAAAKTEAVPVVFITDQTSHETVQMTVRVVAQP